MIDIKIIKNRRGRRICVEAKGHAETAPKGQDLLCAAVSSQMLGLSLAVSELDGRRIVGGTVDVGFGEGIVDVTLAKGRDYRTVEKYVTPAEAVFEAYEEYYPDAIRVTYETN